MADCPLGQGLGGAMRSCPIRDAAELEGASTTRLRAQLAYEVALLLDQRGWTQEELAHKLGYESASSVSRWLSGHAVVSVEKAVVLDALAGNTSLEIPHAELRSRYEKSRRQNPVDRQTIKANTGSFDVFLASPMASVPEGEAYSRANEAAGDLARIIESYCSYRVYYAGDAIESADDFEAPIIALTANVEALLESRHFLLMTTQPSQTSSIWVEAGMALALRKPSTFFVPSPDYLPYMLRQIVDAQQLPNMPPVQVFYEGSIRKIANLVKKHRSDLFERLNHFS